MIVDLIVTIALMASIAITVYCIFRTAKMVGEVRALETEASVLFARYEKIIADLRSENLKLRNLRIPVGGTRVGPDPSEADMLFPKKLDSGVVH